MRRLPRDSKLSTYVPKSPKEMTRLQRRLAEAGFHGFTPVLIYAFSEIALAGIGFLTVVAVLGPRRGAIFAVVARGAGLHDPRLHCRASDPAAQETD